MCVCVCVQSLAELEYFVLLHKVYNFHLKQKKKHAETEIEREKYTDLNIYAR